MAQFKRHNPAHPPEMPNSKPSEKAQAYLGMILEHSKHLIEDRLTDGGKVESAEQ